jgi:3-dehydroquinate dehydratase / shikimate dehydrogenase
LPKSITPHIFVAVAAQTLQGLEEHVSKLSAPMVGCELRLDYLQEFADLEARLRHMLMHLHLPPVIATCRRVEAGGHFEGPIEHQLAVLAAAARAGCQWVDIEIESLKQNAAEIINQFQPVKVIVSFHNYRNTAQLGEIYRKLSRLPAQVIKVASYARNLEDNVQVYKLLKNYHTRSPKLVALAMGPSGLPSRLLNLRWGSPFTYASINYNSSLAAGQLPADVMRSVYRVDHIDQRTQLYGVVGSHASLSLSPAMHNAAFQAKHVNAVYIPCETQKMADFMKFARDLSFLGFSVTMPYKQSILKELDWIDPLAERIGACNTVAVQRGKWMGWNTDAAAVVEVLSKRLRLAGSRILVLGAGGAARAAVFALRQEGAEVLITARREAVAKKLSRAVDGRVIPWGDSESLEVDAVINSTPVGMPPHTEAIPIDLSRLRVRVVFDMVYYPMDTRFLVEARGRGLITISGLEMLVAQGARQFEIWTGQSAPRALMEQAVRTSLDHPTGN